MDNPQGVYTSELGDILRNHIEGLLKPFKKRCRGIIKGEIDFTPVLKSPKKNNSSKKPKRKKERKSIVIAKQAISFAFDGDQQALRRFPGIDEVLSKLGGWKIKGVKRESANIYDVYYSHATLGKKKLRSALKKKKKKCRSVNEVVNYLLPEGYPKLHSKKGQKKGNGVKDENNNPESKGTKRKRGKGKNKVKKVSRKRKNGVFLGASSSSSSSQKNEEKSIILREEVSAESSEVQILIPYDDGKLEDMLDNYAANSDKWIVAVADDKKMEEDLDEIMEEFPEYDDLANQFFN
ncbi:hypothetical protein TSUD_264890 [Trifolium subterraneum]|uniref:Uncharacterized protein n=1 Tax=Trifolium subterraneum TaxID=3900 RepID=A0A2Z6M7Y4_TRISU|nr:hypothetical protein TSUD_264890 [Trifolium subterraneum]